MQNNQSRHKTLSDLVVVSCAIIVFGCSEKKSQAVDDARLATAAEHPGEWLTHGLNYNEDRYSLLSQINKNNVTSFGLAWTTDLASKRGVEATPLIADWRDVP